MTQCVVKNKTSSAVKMYTIKEDNRSEYILYPGTNISLEDLEGSTIRFDGNLKVTTNQHKKGPSSRPIRKTLKDVDSVDILTCISKITLSK
jgi:hypothetical protein